MNAEGKPGKIGIIPLLDVYSTSELILFSYLFQWLSDFFGFGCGTFAFLWLTRQWPLGPYLILSNLRYLTVFFLGGGGDSKTGSYIIRYRLPFLLALHSLTAGAWGTIISLFLAACSLVHCSVYIHMYNREFPEHPLNILCPSLFWDILSPT